MKNTEQLAQQQSAKILAASDIGADYRCENDIYVDYELFADNILGFDWKAGFFFDTEAGAWSEITYYKSIADGISPYEDTSIEPPTDLKKRAEDALAKAKAGAA